MQHYQKLNAEDFAVSETLAALAGAAVAVGLHTFALGWFVGAW